MPNLAEIFDKLRTELLADSVFAALLGKSDGIFREYPAGVNRKPFLILNLPNHNLQTQISGTGVYRPTITFDVIVLNPWDANPIYTHLVENFDIPLNKTAIISSTNYRIDLLSFPDMIESAGQIQEVASGVQVREFIIDVKMRITKLTA